MNQTTLPTVPEVSDEKNKTLPLIVAKKWGFLLAYVETSSGLVYHIQDWIKGLTQVDDVRLVWGKARKQLLISIQQLPYDAPNGKTYQMDFTDDKGLYLIAQNLRATKSRPQLAEIKKYLAEAGAFVDLVRREPGTVITSGAIDPDAAIEAAIQAYMQRGKDERWIAARLAGKIKRVKFTAALTAAVNEVLNKYHYAQATDEVYLGLWGRTAAYLRDELQLPKAANLRDNQPTVALTYQGLAEEVAAQRLGDRSELSWHEAKLIVREVADLIGVQAQATSHFLNMDLATGKPLLAQSDT